MTFACKSEIISMTLPIGDPSSAEAVAAYASSESSLNHVLVVVVFVTFHDDVLTEVLIAVH